MILVSCRKCLIDENFQTATIISNWKQDFTGTKAEKFSFLLAYNSKQLKINCLCLQVAILLLGLGTVRLVALNKLINNFPDGNMPLRNPVLFAFL